MGDREVGQQVGVDGSAGIFTSLGPVAPEDP